MTYFRIAAAQVASVRGDLERNLVTHLTAIETAARHGVSALVFPELSLTGYEPDLAMELALTAADSRMFPLVTLAKQHGIEVIVGAPLRNAKGKPFLGAVLISANGAVSTYAKMHLGASEQAYFTAGACPLTFTSREHKIGIAICADTSQTSHPRAYAEAGATIYAAGVFLNAEWHPTDASRLARHAALYRMLVVMANHAKSIGTYISIGKSAVWAPDGKVLVQAEGTNDSLVIATRNRETWRGEVVRTEWQTSPASSREISLPVE